MTANKQNIDPNYALLGKLIPQDIEIEIAVLGALMIDSSAIIEINDKLKSEHFYKEAHQHIYSAICTLAHKNKAIDLLTVANQLKANNLLESIGGASYIASLTNRVASSANIYYHVEIIKACYVRRQVITSTNEIIKNAFENSEDLNNLLVLVENLLEDISKATYSNKEVQHVSSVLIEAEKDLHKRIDLHKIGKMPGITTGFKELDKKTKGWQKNNLIIEAARPGMGKTAMLLKHALSAAKTGVPVCIFSMEMNDIRLVDRILIGMTGINADNYREGNLTDSDLMVFQKAKEYLATLPIYIDDNPVCSTNYVRTVSKRLKAKDKCGMILIDYLQLTDVETGTNKQYNREQQITKVSRAYKVIAKELDVPLILLCQLSRAVETRGSKKPILSDLRESGSIEQDADVVIFLYRPEYYGEEGYTYTDERGNFLYGEGFLVIAKQREGPLCDVSFSYNRSLTQLWDWDDRDKHLPTSGQTIKVPLPVNTTFSETNEPNTNRTLLPVKTLFNNESTQMDSDYLPY